MKTIYDLRLAALIRLQILCESISALLTPIEGYTALKTALDKAIKKVTDARAINEASIKDKAQIKVQARFSMVALVTKYLGRALVKANDVHDTTLLESLTFPKNYLSAADDNIVAVRADEIKTIIKDNLTILTNILIADIVLMDNAIALYNDLESAPKDAINHRKTEGTDPIPQYLSEAEIPRDFIGKIFLSDLPEYADAYNKAIKVGKSVSVRHISAIIKYTDAETAVVLRNVQATFISGDNVYVKTSTRRGFTRFHSLGNGNYSLTSELRNYQSDIKNNIAIEDSHILKLTIPLQKIVLTGTLEVNVKDSNGNVLPNVKLTIANTTWNLLTNDLGIATKKDVPPAVYQGLLSLEDYKSVDFTFTMDAKRTLSLQFVMEKEE